MVDGTPPSPTEIASATDLSPQQARALADAMRPVQNVANIGSSVGAAMDDAPGTGPRLAGAALQNAATQVELAASTAETAARAIEFYVEAQQTGTVELFPRPDVLAQQAIDDFEPLLRLIER